MALGGLWPVRQMCASKTDQKFVAAGKKMERYPTDLQMYSFSAEFNMNACGISNLIHSEHLKRRKLKAGNMGRIRV